jgi:hypothetical protein
MFNAMAIVEIVAPGPMAPVAARVSPTHRSSWVFVFVFLKRPCGRQKALGQATEENKHKHHCTIMVAGTAIVPSGTRAPELAARVWPTHQAMYGDQTVRSATLLSTWMCMLTFLKRYFGQTAFLPKDRLRKTSTTTRLDNYVIHLAV